MVSWDGDGEVSGYNPTTHKPGWMFKLTQAGSVDLEGETRLCEKVIVNTVDVDDTHNYLEIRAPFTFTGANIDDNVGAWLGMGVYIADADNWAEGVVPTPEMIYGLPASKVHVVQSYDARYADAPGHTTTSWVSHAETAFLNNKPNKKFWVLVFPARLENWTTQSGTKSNTTRLGGAINSVGRAISVLTDQSPGKPTITAPASGTVAAPGSIVALKYLPDDPDSTYPYDAKNNNRDLGGAQVQYAAVPTAENPTVDWQPLPAVTLMGDGYAVHSDAEFFRSVLGYANDGGEVPSLVNSLSLNIQCAVEDPEQKLYHGQLPAGDWQVRVRTFDFGHPFPAVAGVAGLVQPWAKVEDIPAHHISPWSDPIRISIPTQVPPPIALSPSQNIALQDGEPFSLIWQYRNTHFPPYEQMARTVQVRKVGDPDWSTVYSGLSSAHSISTPDSIVQTAVPDKDYLAPNGGFENGLINGWTPDSSTLSAPTGAPPAAHSGNRRLHLTQIPTGTAGYFYFCGAGRYFSVSAFDPAHDLFTVDLWYKANPNDAPDPESGVPVQVQFQIAWMDEAGEPITPPEWISLLDWDYISIETRDITTSEWAHYVSPPVKRHPRAATLLVVAEFAPPNNDPASGGLSHGADLDDVQVIGSSEGLDDFSFDATNQYEWRVQVIDEAGVVSGYSEPARFWVVPQPVSGNVRPVPSQTIEGATLGCGTHRAFIYRRGGTARVAEITSISHLDWSRVRDDISTAQVEVSGWDIDCGNLLSVLQPWAYEVVIFRDNGYSVDRVWEGPITLLTWERDKVTIQAKDVMGYFYRRIIKQKMTDTGTGDTVVNRAKRVLQNTGVPDDPNVLAYLNPISLSDDAMEYRSTPAYSRTAFEEVDDMAANAGLDYTAIGRSILLWDTSHRIGTLPEFRDEDLGATPIVSQYGMSMSNYYAVSDGNGVFGVASRLNSDGTDPIYGRVEMLSSTWASDSTEDTGTYTQEGLETVRQSFTEFAERSIGDRYPAPLVVRVPDNTTLNPDAVVSIQQLVPGVAIPLRSTGTLRSVVALQKLDSIKVVEEAGRETISITLSPFSSDDAAVDAEEEG